jgi:hypothetical protein
MKSKNALSGLALLSLIFWATAFCVSAEQDILSLKGYRNQKTNQEAMQLTELYLKGIGEGLQLANSELEAVRRQQPLFCPPPQLSLRSSNFVDILEQEIKRQAWRDDTPLALILLRGLQNTFPCPK